MANILATLGLEVDASGGIRGLRDFDNATDRTGRNVSELTRLARNLGLAFGAYEVLQWTKDTIALADAYTTMQSRLSLVTTSAENLATIQRELFGLAQESRTPLESVSLLYERLARVSGELGLTQEEVLRHTETINKAMVISGTSAEGTRAALIQLSQGFAAGTLRGDELNAVLEQAPRLAQAIADGMGVSVGQLRRMGAEGKLTAQAIVDALEDQAAAIDREFGGMEMTVGGAMTRLRNAWMAYVGDANEASGATSGLAEAINGLADAIEPVGQKVNAFFGGIALMAVDAAVAWEGFKARMASGLPDWMLTAEGRANKANAAATLDALEDWREAEYARITGSGVDASTRAYGAGLGGGANGATAPSREAERQARAYREMRLELQYAREDREEETRDLERSTLAREYNRNALEHERRVREILAEQAPQYHAELIRESEAVMAAANAHAQRTDRLERETDLLTALVEADRAATAQAVAMEEERRRAMEQPFENAIENIQRGWGELFSEILEQGRITAGDLGALFRRAGGELLAGMATARLQGSVAAMFGLSGGGDLTLGQQMTREALGGALAGGVVGYGVGRATENAAGGLVGGAASGALAGAMFGPLGAAAGGALGAITGLIGGITGAGEAAKRAREAQEQYRNSIEALEATLRGDRVAEGIARVAAEMDALRQQLNESGLGGPVWRRADPTGTYQQELARLNELEAERIAQLREEYELLVRHTTEDLQVRALEAQGRDEEAARLRLQLDHQRELDDLIKQIDADGTRTAAEEALLAQMLYTQELERTAQAMAGVNQQAANLPATFKMAGYVFEAMQELTTDQYRRAVFAGTGAAAPGAPPAPSAGAVPPAGGSAGSGEPLAIGPVTLMLNENVLAKGMLKVYKRGASGPGKEKTAAILSDITVS